jgi:hypothetical protein
LRLGKHLGKGVGVPLLYFDPEHWRRRATEARAVAEKNVRCGASFGPPSVAWQSSRAPPQRARRTDAQEEGVPRSAPSSATMNCRRYAHHLPTACRRNAALLQARCHGQQGLTAPASGSREPWERMWPSVPGLKVSCRCWMTMMLPSSLRPVGSPQARS